MHQAFLDGSIYGILKGNLTGEQMSTQTNTTADALMGLADAFEKVAMAIEEQEANEKTAGYQGDYGSLGGSAIPEGDALTNFLLS